MPPDPRQAQLWSKTPLDFETDPRLRAMDRRVYAYVDRRAGRRGWWWGSQDEIARDLGISVRSVKRAIAKLRGDPEALPPQPAYLSTLRSADHRTQLTYFVHARGAMAPDRDPSEGTTLVTSEGTTLVPSEGTAVVTSSRARDQLSEIPEITPENTPAGQLSRDRDRGRLVLRSAEDVAELYAWREREQARAAEQRRRGEG